MNDKNPNLLFNVYFSKIQQNTSYYGRGIVHEIAFKSQADAINFYFDSNDIKGVVCAREGNKVKITENSRNRIIEDIQNMPFPNIEYITNAMEKITASTKNSKKGWELNVSDYNLADKLIGQFRGKGLYFSGYGTFENNKTMVRSGNRGETTAAYFDMETKRDHNNEYKLRFTEAAFFKLKATFLKEHEGFTFDMGINSKDDDTHSKLGIIREVEHYKLVPIAEGKQGIQVNQLGMNKLNKLGLVNEVEMGISSISTFKFTPPNGKPGKTEAVKTFLKEKPSPLIEKIAQDIALFAAASAEEKTAEFHLR